MATSDDSGMNTSNEMLEADRAPPTKKKKGFLNKMRCFFRRRTKSKDDDLAPVKIKAKSTSQLTSALQEDEDGAGSDLSGHKVLSMSADSVFDHSKKNSPKMISAASLDKAMFAAELNSKLRPRRADDDDGLPSSPITVTTADVLGDRLEDSKDSDMSLGSMDSVDNEIEHDFFNKRFNSGVHSMINLSPTNDFSCQDVDLNVVSSMGNLSNQGARHKITVSKQRGKRTSQRIRKRRTTSEIIPENEPTSTSPILSKVEEEKKIVQLVDEAEKIESEAKQEEVEEVKEKLAEPEPVVSEELNKDTKPAAENPKETEEAKGEEEPSKTGVVMRRKNNPPNDVTKRATVMGTETTVFGERKVAQRSSLREPVEIDEVEEDKSPEEGNSEFAQMFSKLRSTRSKRLEKLEAEGQRNLTIRLQKDKGSRLSSADLKANEPDKKPEPVRTPSIAKQKAPESAKEPKVEKAASFKRASETEKKTTDVKTKEVKTKEEPKVEKSASFKTSERKTVEPKAKEEPSEPKKTINLEKSDKTDQPKVVAPLPTGLKSSAVQRTPSDAKKTVTISADKTDQPKVVAPLPSGLKSSAVQRTPSDVKKTVTISATKTVPTKETKPSEKKAEPKAVSPATFKKESPVPKDRNRSKTLPDKPTESAAEEPSPNVKRAKSHGAADENKPSWIALARSKTEKWGDNDQEVEEKENKFISKNEGQSGEGGDRKSKVLDMVKMWSNN